MMEREVEEVTFRGEETELTTETDFTAASSSFFEDSYPPDAAPDGSDLPSSSTDHDDHHFHHPHHDPHDTSSSTHHSASGHSSGSKMFFHSDFGDTILFKDWITSSHSETFYVCVSLFMFAILFEALKCYQKTLIFKKNFRSNCYPVAAKSSANGLGPHHPTDGEVADNSTSECHDMKPWLKQIFSWIHVVNTLIHVTQIFMGYILMLAVMTYNLWILLAVLLGAGMGFFLCGWKRRTCDSSESSIPSSDNCYLNKSFVGF